MKVLAVCVGRPEKVVAKSGLSGINKRPQKGPVEVQRLGLAGDHIVDTDHHGGPDQAVYLFGASDRIWWADQLGADLAPGYFGENLLIEGLESATLCLGDILEGPGVTLQITSPRIPCATLAWRMGSPKSLKTFMKAERPGAYARVLRCGPVAAGETFVLRPYQGDRISIIDNMRAYQDGFSDDALLRRMAATPAHFELKELATARFSP